MKSNETILPEAEVVRLIQARILRPFSIKWMKAVVPGSPVVAVGARDCRDLTRGKVYTAINGREDGIFESRPFVTVVADDGNKHSYHLSRFQSLESEESA